MKIYYKKNKEILNISDKPFTGLVSMDIGFKSFGLTFINPNGDFKTLDFKPFSDDLKVSKLSIPEYIELTYLLENKFLKLLENNPSLLKYSFSGEIPSIVGSFAPALSILLSGVTHFLLNQGIPCMFFTGNRLGGFYLKKRSYTKTEIVKLVKEEFKIDYKISDHEADSLLQAYSIYLGVFGKYLKDVHLRPFELELQDIENYVK